MDASGWHDRPQQCGWKFKIEVLSQLAEKLQTV
jgi:hypothetical protein